MGATEAEVPSIEDALRAVQIIKQYVMGHSTPSEELLDCSINLDNLLKKEHMSKNKMKRTKIFHFIQ